MYDENKAIAANKTGCNVLILTPCSLICHVLCSLHCRRFRYVHELSVAARDRVDSPLFWLTPLSASLVLHRTTFRLSPSFFTVRIQDGARLIKMHCPAKIRQHCSLRFMLILGISEIHSADCNQSLSATKIALEITTNIVPKRPALYHYKETINRDY